MTFHKIPIMCKRIISLKKVYLGFEVKAATSKLFLKVMEKLSVVTSLNNEGQQS